MNDCLQRHIDSNRQARSVNQDQICPGKHDMEFGSLLFKSSVSCLSEAQLPLDNSKDVLHFCPDGKFCVFDFLGGVLPTPAQSPELRRAAVDHFMTFFLN